MLKCGFNLKTQTKFASAIAWRESVLSELTPIVWCRHRGKAECSPTAVATEDLHSQCAHPSLPQHSSLPSLPQHQPPAPFCLMFLLKCSCFLLPLYISLMLKRFCQPTIIFLPFCFNIVLPSLLSPFILWMALTLYTTFHHCLYFVFI